MQNCSNVKEIVSGAAHAGCGVLALVDAIDADDGIQPSTGAPLMDTDDVLRGMFNLYLICHIFYFLQLTCRTKRHIRCLIFSWKNQITFLDAGRNLEERILPPQCSSWASLQQERDEVLHRTSPWERHGGSQILGVAAMNGPGWWR